MIAVIDYGVGNLFSLSSSLAYLGLENKITRSARELDEASHIILPGVGAFGDAMEKLASTGLVPELERQAENGKPLLGICLGMQLLFEKSYEYGEHAGLGLLPGSVCPLEPDLAAAGFSYKVPHIGWNSLHLVRPENPLMANTREGDFVYFVHSFYVKGCGDALVAGRRIRRDGARRGGAGQCVRLPVSPGKKRRSRPAHPAGFCGAVTGKIQKPARGRRARRRGAERKKRPCRYSRRLT